MEESKKSETFDSEWRSSGWKDVDFAGVCPTGVQEGSVLAMSEK